MKKGLSSTDSPEEKNFNSILAFDSEVVKDKFKELALIVALKEVAKQNDLSLRQQVEIYSPEHWNEPPSGLGLDKEFEAFKRCGSQGFIAITEKFDFELANKSWYSNHLTFRNKQIYIDADHIGFKSNQGYKKQFIKPPVYIDKKIKKPRTLKDIHKIQMEINYD
tara:strand:+ start:53 stop:547 length:495 start_codon:yes stop_codon:yes gene_type:complete